MSNGLIRFRSPLLAESLLMSFPPGTEMFQFPGFASCPYGFRTGSPCGGVSPFGYLRINDRSHLPAAFRSVPRPSSPLSAKASTERPYLTPSHHSAPARRTINPRMTALRPSPSELTPRDRCSSRHYSMPQTTYTPIQIHLSKQHARIRQHPSQAQSNRQTSFPKKVDREALASTSHHVRQPRQQPPNAMETIGFEPMTPCLQSRCSTN